MRFSLSDLTRRARNPRRSLITIRPISPPATRATDLYRSAYLPIVSVWSNAIEPILAEYERSLSELQTDSAATVQAEIERVDGEVGAFVLSLRIRVERWAAALEAWHRSRWRANVLAATGVDLGTLIGPADARETIEMVIARNVSLVRNVSDQARQRMSDAVFRGLQNRTPSRQLAGELRDAVAMSRRRALNIAADQNSKLGGALNAERRRQAGIDSFRWRHSGKLHPRQDHVSRDGKLYSENPERVGKEYQGQTIRKPPEDRASQLPFCGCVEAAVLILD